MGSSVRTFRRLAAVVLGGLLVSIPAAQPTVQAAHAGKAGKAGQAAADARGSARREYARRSVQLPGADLDARCQLARWCLENRLFTEMRREALGVLRVDPDHAGARALLGQESVEGQWMSRSEARRKRGLVLYKGQWMRKYDVVKKKHEAAQRRKHRALEREVRTHLHKLTSSSDKVRGAALTSLLAIADREVQPALAETARTQHAYWGRYWHHRRIVLATVRLQHSQLLGLTPFTTSLGTGTPVTLQLPQMRSIGVNTTVAIPAGVSR